MVLQSIPVNTDTEGGIESVIFNGVSVISGSCYLSQKFTQVDAPLTEKTWGDVE